MTSSLAKINAEINSVTAVYDDIEVESCEKFTDLPLSSNTQKGLEAAGYTSLTDIQRESLIYGLRGSDILGAAKTGSGKTLAFVIPLLECLWREKFTALDGLGGLVISPTRELALQIFEVIRTTGRFHDLSVGLVIGGKDLKWETQRIGQSNILICTPGRLLQHMDENPRFTCDNLQMLVLDEADRCLDLGFKKTLSAIVENLPSERQTLLFSATQTKSVKDLALLSLVSPRYISAHESAVQATPSQLQQAYAVVPLYKKLDYLFAFLKNHIKKKTLVFLSTCKQVRFVHAAFCRLRPGVTLLALHGKLHQLRRIEVYNQFCRKESAVLFATDLAARGLDFPGVGWVVQMDCPEDPDAYIHRVGRTARYRSDGQSIMFLLPTEELRCVEKLREKKIPLEETHVNPEKEVSIKRKLEAMCARDSELKASAQRAFIAYCKSYHLTMKGYALDLPFDKFASSLGLVTTPRVRFLKKRAQSNAAHNVGNVDVDVNKLPTDEVKEDGNQLSVDVKGDLFSVKTKDVFNVLEDGKIPEVVKLPVNVKVVSKAAAVKKMRRMGLRVNTKIKFDEDGVIEEHWPQRAEGGSGEGLGGLDIGKQKELMKREDKLDRSRYREAVKRRKKQVKTKLKEKQRRQEWVADDITGDVQLGDDSMTSLQHDEDLVLQLLSTK